MGRLCGPVMRPYSKFFVRKITDFKHIQIATEQIEDG